MKKAEALKTYKNTENIELVKLYSDAAKYYVSNRDRNLLPIYIPLPKPPAWHLIDNFGMEPEDQYFRRKEVPERIKELESKFDTIDEIYEELKENYHLYRKELKYIQDEIYFELYGYWFFNNGVPTYISGYHYVELNHWKGPDGYMQYRDRDREWFLFADYMIRLKNFLGFNTPKPRQCGDTTKACVIIYLRMSRKLKANSGLQSKTDGHAAEVFEEHFVEPWRSLPFWLKPLHKDSDDPKSGLNFIPPPQTASKNRSTGRKGAVLAKSRGLESKITFKSSGLHAYDTWRLYCYHGDEVGKTKDVDIYNRTMIVRKAMARGAKIDSFMINTSTVNEMLKAGGLNFKRLCDQSMFHDSFKSPTGRTASFLATLFQSGTRGLEGFVGKYGEDIVDTPTPEQVEYSKKAYPYKIEAHHYIGSYEKIMNERKMLQEAKDIKGLNEEIRMTPIEYRECWKKAVTDNGFPSNRMEDRVADIALIKAGVDCPIRRGDFVLSDEKDFHSRIIFIEHERGLFEISVNLPDNLTNRIIINRNQRGPAVSDWGIAGGDEFQPKKTEGRRMSDGGGAVFQYKTKEDNESDVMRWVGNRFVCVYRHRPDTIEEYCKHMLFMCRYFGVHYFPENNLYEVPRYFIKMGYAGFLKYEYDAKQNRWKHQAGWTNTGDNPKRVWNKLRDHFNIHTEREMHSLLLDEGIDIDGVEQLTDFDVLVAAGSCLYGAEDMSMEETTQANKRTVDIREFFAN
jgi:hypothetical protein